jgi:hypothetical protein
MTTPVLNPSAVVEPTFTATFTIKVNGIRTATVNGLENTVKQVDWALVGEEAGQKFELPQTSTLADPASEGFVPLANLTEAAVASWIEATATNLDSVKAHIQLVLDKEVARAGLTSTAMPWAPVVEMPAPTPTPTA